MKRIKLDKRITILVNSCDSYSDLWIPFFTLLKKYWDTEGISVLLNTETKDFKFEGLDIECVHCPNAPYGRRIRHALRTVRTKYVIIMLDDFFLRQPVDNEKVNQIVNWMENDKQIVYFNYSSPKQGYDLKSPYENFTQILPGASYTLSLQLGIWRKEKLISYWLDNISPWEWEIYTDIKPCWHKRDRFYHTSCPYIFDYGFYNKGEWMGVQRGKWVLEDVVPLFEREGIFVDYEKRNSQSTTVKLFNNLQQPSKGRVHRLILKYKETIRLLGLEGAYHLFFYHLDLLRCKLYGRTIDKDFYSYTRNKAREKYFATVQKS